MSLSKTTKNISFSFKKSLQFFKTKGLETAYAYLIVGVCSYFLCASRLGPILSLPWISKLNPLLTGLTIFSCIFFLFNHSKRALFLISITLLGVLSASYVNLYTPYFSGYPQNRDWMFGLTVSSGFIWSLTKDLLQMWGFALLSGITLGKVWPSLSTKSKRALTGLISLCLLANVAVAIVQNATKNQFLAAGSGSALTSGRAPGLLEDSGASSVIVAIIFSGLFSCLCKSLKKRQNIYKYFLLLLFPVFIAGIASGGRIFLVSSLLSFCVITYMEFRPLKRLLAFGILVGFFSTMKYFYDQLIVHKFHDSPFWETLAKIDPVRALHAKVMILSFLEKPIIGQGLGTFASNLEIFKSQAHIHGGWYFQDPATNFYLMLASELGLSGILIALGILIITVIFFKNTNTSTCKKIIFTRGAIIAVLVSWLVGLQFVFYSFTSLTSIFLAAVYSETKYNLAISKIIKIICAFTLTLACFGKIYDSISKETNPVLFRWASRHSPQPLPSINVPISSRGLKGKWVVNNSVYLLDRDRFKFFFERPIDQYPLEITFRIMDQQYHQLSAEKFILDKGPPDNPGSIKNLTIPTEIWDSCKSWTQKRYCQWTVEIKPNWFFDYYDVGPFVEE